MAANENMEGDVTNSGGNMIVESVINRWIVDYYTSVALCAFRNGKYRDFCEIRDILQNLLVRPLESTDVMPRKIQIMQFLSRINDGERLDCCFESEPATPLESAFIILNNISEDLNVCQQDLKKVHKSIREMLVILCIKNKQYDKAKEALTRYFPKGMVGKKAIFMGLINKKINKHVVLEQVAKQLIEGRKAAEQKKNTTEQDASVDLPQPPADKPDTSAPPPLLLNRPHVVDAVTALAKELGEENSFARLENEWQKGKKKESGPFFLCLSPSPLEGSDAEPDQDDPSQRDSGSRMEAFQANKYPATEVEIAPMVQEDPLVELVPTVQEDPLVEVVPTVQEDPLVEVVPTVQEDSLVEVVPMVQEVPLVKVVPTVQEVPEEEKVARTLQKRSKLHTMARLVMEPDSQLSQQEPVASEQEPVASEQEPPVVELEKLAGPSRSLEDPLSSQPACRTPTRKHRKRPAPSEVDEISSESDVDVCALDDSSDGSPKRQAKKSSTPQKNHTPQKGDPHHKWKKLLNHAKGIKTTWSEEDSLFNTPLKDGSGDSSSSRNSGGKRRMWSLEETEWLRKGVARYGEGHWERIKASYPFGDRTAVNIKDRWRTMKKLNIA
ncbi:telomeric repeat binding factor a isoform X2 [Hypomesus transpacificus]|uniref:telomeric repeat binding factor a isoform X2 n=1 Tax=Hypomesus transpacificus TaxID=137520 RepID=UPI001F0720B8|nr:telomeric repeat binding factor a isoform X2 [Hypomesus transpacificus]